MLVNLSHGQSSRIIYLSLIRYAAAVDKSQSASKCANERRTISLLVGKHIKHTFAESVYHGKVISQVPGFPAWLNVVYDDDDAVYSYKLVENAVYSYKLVEDGNQH
jgi:hypothetical protein